jgi:hypothetical protein
LRESDLGERRSGKNDSQSPEFHHSPIRKFALIIGQPYTVFQQENYRRMMKQVQLWKLSAGTIAEITRCCCIS